MGKDTEEKLPFAYREVVRLMKNNLEEGKSIREHVKIAMNELLYEILVDICRALDDMPYQTIELEMFKEAAYGYKNVKSINVERKALLSRLDTMKRDIQLMEIDINKKLKFQENDKEVI